MAMRSTYNIYKQESKMEQWWKKPQSRKGVRRTNGLRLDLVLSVIKS